MDPVPQLSEMDARIYTALARDPEARRKMAPEVRRLIPEVPIPEYDAQIANQAMIEAAMKPLQERLESMEKEKKEKETNEYWTRQRNDLKRVGYDDEGVQKFEERLGKDFANGQLSYLDLHYYYQAKDHPLPPGSMNVGLNGVPRSSLESQWRQDMKNPETNPGTRAFKGDKPSYFRSLWNKAQEEKPR